MDRRVVNRFLIHLLPDWPEAVDNPMAPPVAEDWEEYVVAVDEIARAFPSLRAELTVRRDIAIAKGKEMRGRGEVRRVPVDDPNVQPQDPRNSVRSQGGVRLLRNGKPLPEESPLLISEQDRPVNNQHRQV